MSAHRNWGIFIMAVSIASQHSRYTLPRGRYARPYRLLFGFVVSLAMMLVASCSEDYSPTAPTSPIPPLVAPAPTPTPRTGTYSLTMNIMDADTRRACIENARAEIIAGPYSGTIYPQNWGWCEEDAVGVTINGIPVGAVVRLRVSAPGYTSVELDLDEAQSGRSFDINLKRAD
jgi:hypothetical protein